MFMARRSSDKTQPIPGPELEYVFRVEWESCHVLREWVRPMRVTTPNNGNYYATAAMIAAERITPTDTGVKVSFLGLRKKNDSDRTVTELNPFTVVIKKSK